ncbi:hypothetical protein [Corynebacterium amycolatum]|uniref:hypothetical protein n=1 Tax=Corynebacterium amycolatum TaxID=43765 RepID=UPI00234E087A|nr:hypothetical protein [Corynebacterium amycolatum]MDC7116138.1 hypothetical protein [Corynebacterium amycolatum]
MTPEEARKLLEGTTLGPWEVEMHHESGRPDVATFWIAGRTGDQVAEQETLGRHFDVTESDFYLIAAAPDMTAMIANMRTEYTVEYQPVPGPEWYRISEWSEEYPLIDGEELNPRERIVKRYVTPPQPLGEEQ